jgi:hypothetical protein
MKNKTRGLLSVLFIWAILACNPLFSSSDAVTPTASIQATPNVVPELTDKNITEEPADNKNDSNTWCNNDYYPVVKGAVWKYQITDNKNTKLYYQNEIVREGTYGEYYVSTVMSQSSEIPPPSLQKDANLFCVSGGVIVRTLFGNFYLPNDLPVSAGSTWQDSEFPDGSPYTVLGTETLKVPAGSFQAVKVLREGVAPDGIKIYRWFVKGVGLVKVYIEDGDNWSSQDLESYTIPNP